MDMQIEANELLEAMNAEFPLQFTVVAQRLHIKKLEEKLQEAQTFQEVVKEPNG